MKHRTSLKLSLLLGSILLVATGCASGHGRSASSSDVQGPAFQVASMLSGTYALRDDKSDLRLQIGSTGGIGSAMDLVANTSGTYEGRPLSQQQVIHLVSEGNDVRMSVIPRSAPVPETSPEARRLSSTEVQAACTLYLEAKGERWAGATQGPGVCMQGVGGGVASQWQVEIQPDAIRFVDLGRNETLVFQKTSEAASR